MIEVVLSKIRKMSKLVDALSHQGNNKKMVTFQSAKNEPIHRWFPYLEGFSEEFIRAIYAADGGNAKSVYEPFAGSGTVPVFAIKNGMECYYQEVNPYLAKVIELKGEVLRIVENCRADLVEYCELILDRYETTVKFLEESEDLKTSYTDTFSPSVYFTLENYSQVLKSRSFLDNENSSELIAKVAKGLLWLAMSESLLHSSLLKRAGDIRFRRGRELGSITPFIPRVIDAYRKIIQDISTIRSIKEIGNLQFSSNAKVKLSQSEFADIIITSPPYLNGTNYIRNTKLELWYDRLLKKKTDLNFYRNEVVTAGINDVSANLKEIDLPSLKELLDKSGNWYDKRIPKMISDYFFDMEKVLINCLKALKPGKSLYLDIGDSIYGGNYIPTHTLLIDLACKIGFLYDETVVLRNRKSKNGSALHQVVIKLTKS